MAAIAVRALPGARRYVRVLGHPYVDVWQSVRPARLGLHAWKLAFAHPVTGRRVELESPLPDALRRIVPPPGGR